MKKENETRNLERFDKVKVVGRVQLHLERSSLHSVRVMTKNASDMADLVTEVRDGELHVYHQTDCEDCKSPKYTIYLNHTGISDLNLSGVVKLRSNDTIFQNDLVVKSEGILTGKLKVSVNNLDVNLDGLSNMNISGHADTTDIIISGLGLLNTRSLKTRNDKKASYGLAMIN